ncbi:MAG: enoyl-CoA hydratase/isomerase family protein [Euryarchaeota archaeon]|nr:enoyl-CoA hydratase/isomerase family protein [Euryarchaeota archaeon]
MAKIEKVLVVGAGTMGSGIAQAAATAGYKTTMVDMKQEFVDAGFGKIKTPLEKRITEGKMRREDLDRILANLKGTTDVEAAAREADLVIEAVFEEFKIKEDLFKRIAKVAKPTVVVATNTSSLSVTQLAKSFGAPDRFGGLHFFNPAAVNKLVEVVKGHGTTPETFSALWDFALRLGKVPIETKDSFGFCVNRFFVPFLNEACRLLEEKVADAATIDAATNEVLGTTMGPFALMNFTGIPIGYHAEETLHQSFGAFYKPADVLREMFEKKQLFEIAGKPDPTKFEAVKARLLGVLFGITAQLVDEGVASREATDKGALLGLRWGHGPFALMNQVGTAQALRYARALHDKWGKAFPLSPSLQKAGERNEAWNLRNVVVDVQGHVAVITIDRPEALNALNPKVLTELGEAFTAVANNKEVRAAVLTGSGKAFVAGADIKAMANQTAMESLAMTTLGQRVVRHIELMVKPVIAAVNGFAFGGGCELALACDVILAAETAQFALPEVGLGIHPGFGGTQRLPRLIGPVRAKELIFTGDRITAQQAEKIGLVNKVVKDAELLPEALRIAHKIAEMAPLAIGLAKESVNRGLETDIDSGLALETNSVTLTFATQDQKEGMRAFLEKRKANFTGR